MLCYVVVVCICWIQSLPQRKSQGVTPPQCVGHVVQSHMHTTSDEMLCCAVLCCIVLYCVVLLRIVVYCCVVLCCVVWRGGTPALSSHRNKMPLLASQIKHDKKSDDYMMPLV